MYTAPKEQRFTVLCKVLFFNPSYPFKYFAVTTQIAPESFKFPKRDISHSRFSLLIYLN